MTDVDDGEGPPRKDIKKLLFFTLIKKASATKDKFLNPEIMKPLYTEEEEEQPKPGSISPISDDDDVKQEPKEEEYDPAAPVMPAQPVLDPRLQHSIQPIHAQAMIS